MTAGQDNEFTGPLCKYLKELHALLNKSSSAWDIVSCGCMIDSFSESSFLHSRASAQIALSMLFVPSSEQQMDLLTFLRKTVETKYVSDKDIVKGKVKILEVILKLLKLFKTENIPLTESLWQQIINTAHHVLQSDPSNSVKTASLDVISGVYQNFSKAASVVTFQSISGDAMVDRLLKNLQLNKGTQGVQGATMTLLGELLIAYQEEFQVRNRHEMLLSWIESLLAKQFGRPKLEHTRIASAFACLAGILPRYPMWLDDDDINSGKMRRQQLFKYFRIILQGTQQQAFSRFEVTKWTLLLIRDLAPHFANEIWENYRELYENILFCCKSLNKTIRKNSFSCLDQVLIQLAKVILLDKRPCGETKAGFGYFMKQFLPLVNNWSADTLETDLAIKGLGMFSCAIKEDAKLFRVTLEKLRQHGEKLLVSSEVNFDKSFARSHAIYLWCYCSFIELTDPEGFSSSVQEFVCKFMHHLVELFHRCEIVTRYFIVQGVFQCLRMLYRHLNNSLHSTMLQQEIKHLLLLTFSHQISISDDETKLPTLYNPKTGLPESKLLYEYLHLWRQLLQPEKSSTLIHANFSKPFSDDELRDLVRKLYDEVLGSTLKILCDLNLSYKKAVVGEEERIDLEPVVPRDHTIFLSLVEFLELMVPKYAPYLFLSWVGIYSTTISRAADRLPLVSGFYRIGAVIMTVCESQGCFEDSEETKNHEMHEILNFLKATCERTNYFRNELLVGCIQFVLSVPTKLVSFKLQVPVVKKALVLGVSHTATGMLALSTLEKWLTADKVNLEQYLEDLVPFLVPYLYRFSKHLQVDSEVEDSSLDMNSSEAENLSRRILMFLGKLGGKNRFLLKSATNTDDIMKWGLEPCFIIGLPLGTLKANVYFDELLPRLVYLVKKQTNRQVKAAASEALHALLQYLCGATKPKFRGGKSDFYSIWRKIFPSLLEFSADTDHFTSNLFEPLVFQLIRWLSGVSGLSNEANALLDALVDGISCKENGALRTCSAKGFAEFLKYAIKQHRSISDSVSQSLSIGSLFDRLFSLAVHPAPMQRVGACITLNHMYKEFREESDLVSTYALAMLKHLLYSLKLPFKENFADEMNFNDFDALQSIQRMEKIITKTSDSLNKADKTRVVVKDLKDFVEWLWEQVNCPCRLYQSTCMDLFLKLSRLVDHCGSSVSFFKAFIMEHGIDRVKEVLTPLNALSIDSNNQSYAVMGAVYRACSWAFSPRFANHESLVEAPSIIQIIVTSSRKRPLDAPDLLEGNSSALLQSIKSLFQNFSMKKVGSLNSSAVLFGAFELLHSLLQPKDESILIQMIEASELLDEKFVKVFSLALVYPAEVGIPCVEDIEVPILDLMQLAIKYYPSASWTKELLSRIQELVFTDSKRNLSQWLNDGSENECVGRVLSVICWLCKENVISDSTINVSSIKLLVHYAEGVARSEKMNPEKHSRAKLALRAAEALGWNPLEYLLNDKSALNNRFYAVFYSELNDLILKHLIRLDPTLFKIRLNVTVDSISVLTNFFITTQEVRSVTFMDMDKLMAYMKELMQALLISVGNMIHQADNESSSSVSHFIQCLDAFMGIYCKCSRKLLDDHSELLQQVKGFIGCVLKTQSRSVSEKADAVDLIRYVLEDGKFREALPVSNLNAGAIFDGVQQLICDYFPLPSASIEELEGTNTADYIVLARRILQVISKSGSLRLMACMYHIIIQDDDSSLFKNVDEMLLQFGNNVITLDCTAFSEMVSSLLDIAMNEALKLKLREKIYDVILFVLENSSKLKRFAAIDSRLLNSLIQAVAIDVEKFAPNFESRLVSSAVAFKTFDCLYRCSNHLELRKKFSSALFGCPDRGQEFEKRILGAARKCIRFSEKTDQEWNKAMRECVQYAYECISTLITKAQTKEKWFNILFQDIDFSALVDRNLNLKFSTLTPKFSFQFADRRSQSDHTNHRQYQGEVNLSSNFLCSSSLNPASYTESDTAEENEEPLRSQSEAVEMDFLNKLPCMMSLLQTIREMHCRFQADWSSDAMPVWMEELYSQFIVTDSIQLQVFIIKLILNAPAIFLPHATTWSPKILNASLEIENQIGYNGFHYFLKDICSLYLSEWSMLSTPPHVSLANDFICHLISQCPHTRRAVLQDNLSVLQQLCIQWKFYSWLQPTPQIMNMISDTNEDSKLRTATIIAGMNIVGFLLKSSLGSSVSCQLDCSLISTTILSLVRSSHKHIRETAAETLGVLIEYQNSKGLAIEEVLESTMDLLNVKMDDIKAYLDLLCRLTLHSKTILTLKMAKRFVSVASMALENDSIAPLAAEMILKFLSSDTASVAEIYVELKPYLPAFLTHRNTLTQKKSLEAFLAFLPKMPVLSRDELFKAGVDWNLIKVFHQHIDDDCRSLLYDALIWMASCSDVVITDCMRQVLVYGMSDSSSDSRRKVYAFWNSNPELTNDCLQRMEACLHGSLRPLNGELGNGWVHSACRLLLSLSCQSMEYESEMFQTPLGECRYEPISIDSSWQHKDAGMKPLFSQDREMLASSYLNRRESSAQKNQIKATQEMAWTQTQATFPTEFSTMASQGVTSSAFFEYDKQPPSYTDEQSKDAKHTLKKHRFHSGFSEKYKNLSERETSTQTRDFFQVRALQSKKRSMAQNRRNRQAKENEVKVYREYRKGELPDIQITLKDIVLPLLALSEVDQLTARLLFVQIFRALHGNEKSMKQRELENQVQEILSKSSNSVVVACLHDTILSTTSMIPYLNPTSIAQSTFSASNLSSAQMILELFLEQYRGTVSVDSHNQIQAWKQLFGIYQENKQDLMLLAFFRQFSHGELRNALKLEFEDHEMSRASKAYKALLSTNSDESLDDIVCRESYRRSLYELNSWKALYKLVMESDGSIISMKGDLSTAKSFLHKTESVWKGKADARAFLTCCLHASLVPDSDFGSPDTQKVLKYYLDEESESLVQNDLSKYACFGYFQTGSLNETSAQIESYYSDFLSKWSTLHPLAHGRKEEMLESLISISLLNETLHVDSQSVTKHLKFWNDVNPSLRSMAAVSNHVAIKIRCFDFISRKFDGLVSKDIFESTCAAMLYHAKAAVQNDLNTFANSLFKRYKVFYEKQTKEPKNSPEFVTAYLSFLQSRFLQIEKRIQSQERGLSSTNNDLQKANLYLPHATNFAREEAQSDLTPEIRIPTARSEYGQWLWRSAKFNLDYDIATSMTHASKAFDQFNLAITDVPLTKTEQRSATKLALANAQVNFAVFVDELLELGVNLDTRHNAIDYAEIFIKNVLCAMRFGSHKAAMLFPRLLNILGSFFDKSDRIGLIFQQYSKSMPAWMFLKWSSQLLSIVSAQNYEALSDVLVRMSTEYPQAIYHEFHLATEGLKMNQSPLRALLPALDNPHLFAFVHALGGLHDPQLRFSESLARIRELLSKQKNAEAKAALTDAWSDCFSVTRESSIRRRIGKKNRAFASRQSEFKSIFGENFSNLSLKTVAAAKKLLKDNPKYGAARLSDYSEYLSELDGGAAGIELPGQYDSKWKRPSPEFHVKILGCNPSIYVLASKQRPKRIEFHGSDEKDYRFLVKGGEDLRLDQRILQLYSLMNTLLDNEKRCSSKLRNRTYKVIPMTTKIGLIEWIDSSETLKSVIESEALLHKAKTEKNTRLLPQSLNILQMEGAKRFLSAYPQTLPLNKLVSRAATVSSDEVSKLLEEASKELPANLLQKRLVRMTTSPESFLYVRESFIHSLAALNVCSYILGVSDRHLDNILLHSESGSLIGIDFGLSFGAGTTDQPWPELVPFRLTSQLREVSHPFDMKSVMEINMPKVLQVLRDNRSEILSLMEVFVSVLNWNDSGRHTTMALSDSIPKQKLIVAKRKLEGDHPASIIADELDQNKFIESISKAELRLDSTAVTCLSKFKQIVSGEDTGSKRANVTLSRGKLSVMEQTQCLLDLATDPNVLGRAYVGWAPWL